ncbi:response regulator transcription factor [uncultured Desulfobacter sp.]|uniref:response regulator transcription factor n=1 Tax=uncultured Desulfobacter sp. TaxID=240139 RepID=UPI002AABE54F|nr:response regulator transcription factor [uncultured Desulfobacter sp.]
MNVLLVEDDFDLAETVIDYLSIESISCDYASNGVAGLNLLEEKSYDVVLLDLNLPRLDGLSLCRELRSKGNDTPVLMLTALGRLDDKVEGFDAGTDDYLVKPFELRELVVRIYALARRRSGQVQLLTYADLEMNLKEDTVSRAGQAIRLSPTARKILETLLRAAPETVSKQKLIDSVWGDDPPDSNSLKVHMHHLRKAVDESFDCPLIHTIPGRGFSIKEGDQK